MTHSNAEGRSSGGAAFRAIIRFIVVVALIIGAVLTTLYVTRIQGGPPPRIALVTADSDVYWDRVIEGAEDAAAAMDVQLIVEKSTGATEDQTRRVMKLLASGVDGLAVSPVDATKQALTLREASQSSQLVTLDSDSELSGRLCFVGTDNYTAGRRCGELIKQALPDGGAIAIIMGPADKDNGRSRRQGIIDELLDRSYGPGRPADPFDATLSGGAYTVAMTMVDETDAEQAKANAAAIVADHPDVVCIVGLYAYHAPAAAQAVAEAGKVGQVTIIGFDDRPETLDGINEGSIYGTVAQDQYNYGYNSVRILAEAARGKGELTIPLNQRLHFPPVIVTKENLQSFMNDRDARRGG